LASALSLTVQQFFPPTWQANKSLERKSLRGSAFLVHGPEKQAFPPGEVGVPLDLAGLKDMKATEVNIRDEAIISCAIVVLAFSFAIGGALALGRSVAAGAFAVFGALACSERFFRIWHTSHNISVRVSIFLLAVALWAIIFASIWAVHLSFRSNKAFNATTSALTIG